MKPCPRFILTLAVLLATHLATAQHGFNKLYDLESSEITRNVVEHEGRYYCSGLIGLGAADYKTFISCLDSTGNLLWEKRFRISGDTTVMFGSGNMIIGKDTLIHQIGLIEVAGDNLVFLHKRSINGDSVATIFYPQLGNATINMIVSDTFNGGYVAAGYQWDGNGGTDLLLFKMDDQGTYLWDTVIDQNVYDGATSVAVCQDSGFVLGGWQWTGSGIDNDLWVVKLRKDGTLQWNKPFDLGPYGDGEGYVLSASDGSIYVASKRSYDDILGYQPRTVFLGKYNTNGQEIWTREYGRISENSDALFLIKESKDGAIFGITNGFYKIPENPLGMLVTFAIKINEQGDSLWSKYYKHGAWEEQPELNYSWAIDATSDGGFITAGFVQGSDPQNAWVVKVDSNGCFDTIHDCVIGIEEKHAATNHLHLWPNPASHILHVASSSPIGLIRVFDATGSLVEPPVTYPDNKSATITLHRLPPGIYTLYLHSDGKLSHDRFIKSN